MTDLAVFYSGDYEIALAIEHFLDGEFDRAERLRPDWLAGRGSA